MTADDSLPDYGNTAATALPVTEIVRMHWVHLSLAILFEVIGTTNMKLSAGFTRLAPSVIMFACFGAAFFFNTLALRKLDLSITYAIWSGVGTAATAAIGFLYFKEPMTALKLGSICLIVVGVIGLRVSFGQSPAE